MGWPVFLEIPSLLDSGQCESLIQSYSTEMKAASVPTATGREVDVSFRNNSVRKFYDNDLGQTVFQKINKYRHIFGDIHPRKVGPYFRLYRYGPGQHFEWHQDGSYKLDNMVSLCTILLYLNDNFDGGKTEFKFSENSEEPLSVDPCEGKMIIFSHEIPHRANPISSGKKFILRSDLYFDENFPLRHFIDLRSL